MIVMVVMVVVHCDANDGIDSTYSEQSMCDVLIAHMLEWLVM